MRSINVELKTEIRCESCLSIYNPTDQNKRPKCGKEFDWAILSVSFPYPLIYRG